MRTNVRLAAVSLAAALMLVEAGRSQSSSDPSSRFPDVIYGRRAGLALTMEVFTPSRPNGLAIAWVVSSSGKSSREQTFSPSFDQRIGPFLKHGYTVFAVIHASSPVFTVRDAIADVRRAVRFIRHSGPEFAIDAGRLAIAGSSAGGSTALTIALSGDDGDAAAEDPVDRVSSRVQAAGAFFSPTDFLNFGENARSVLDDFAQRGGVDPSFQFYDADPKTGARQLVTDRETLLRLLRDTSPVSYVTRDDPPTILIHGTEDRAVPIQQSWELIERLKAVNVDARLVARDGMRHAYAGWEADAELIAQWFDSHLHPNTR